MLLDLRFGMRNAHPVVVISYQLWRERFQGEPNIIGRSQMLNGLPHTIIGVAPVGFAGTFVGYSLQFWVPASMQERFHPGGYMLEDRGGRWIEGFARLKPGVTRAQAQAEISAVARRLENDYPTTNRGRGVVLLSLWQSPFNSAAVVLPALSITLAVASLVLLIACANVGNLLLVRAFVRRREMTVRLAIGAVRVRLLRQLLTEGLLLSAFAAAGGLLLAEWSRNALVLLFPPTGVALNLTAQIDWRVLGVSAGVCLIATVLFGLAPALQASKINLVSGLKFEANGVLGGGLLLRSLQQMRNADPGFATRGVLNASVDLFARGCDAPQGRAFF